MRAVGSAKGLVDSQETLQELRTGKDTNGRDIDPDILSQKLGAHPIQVAASALGLAGAGLGMKNLFRSGGDGGLGGLVL